VTDRETYAALARQANDTAGRLYALAEAMRAARFQPDGWPPDRLRELAVTLHGTALRAAMCADDVDLLNELTGRTWTRLHGREEETVHRCPVGDAGLTPCCGRTPSELPNTDRLTADDHLVTCAGAPAAS
jgi:hypothetical protein